MNSQQTGEDIQRVVENVQFLNGNRRPRPYLGMSNSGEECLRKRFFQFRWCKQETFTARQLRLFKRGHREEQEVYVALRQAGYVVEEVDQETGEQFELVACSGHAKGHTDGKVTILHDILLEIKTHADKYFKPLKKNGVKKAVPSHYDQMQRYMHGTGLKQALYIGVNKNDDTYHFELVDYDETRADLLARKEEAIIFTDIPPDRVSEDPFWYKCGDAWCQFRDICHYGDAPDANCRTCKFGTIVDNGGWECAETSEPLTTPQQRTACADYELLTSITRS